jgi:hypothetical protein
VAGSTPKSETACTHVMLWTVCSQAVSEPRPELPARSRSISPNFIEDVLGSTKGTPVKGPSGEDRLSHVSGSAQVITNDTGNIVITVIAR